MIVSQVCGTYFPPHVQFDEEDEPDMTTRRAAKLLRLMQSLVDAGLSPPRKAEVGAGTKKARKGRRRRGKECRVLRVLPLVPREDAGAQRSRIIGEIITVLVCCGSMYVC